jgi:hypothetical protein
MEKSIALAIKDVQELGCSYQKAADQRGVHKTTLWNRMHGRQERHKAHEAEQALGADEEREVVSWCHRQERRFLPVRLVHIIGCAETIWNNKNGTSGEHLGVHWSEGFMKRHPELTLMTSKRIDEKRVMAKNPAYIMEFYVLVSSFTVPLYFTHNYSTALQHLQKTWDSSGQYVQHG